MKNRDGLCLFCCGQDFASYRYFTGAESSSNTKTAQMQHSRYYKSIKSNVDALNVIQTIEPKVVNSFNADNRWEMIDIAVDSGVSETVIGQEMLQNVQTQKGDASRRGFHYEVANGVQIQKLGETLFKGHTIEGMARNVTAQVCKVNRALLSVKRIAQAGNEAVFDADASYIEDRSTGEKMWLREETGMYMLCMLVKNEGF